MVTWTRRDIYFYLVLGSVPTSLYHFAGWTWLTIPWVPIAIVGTAVAFIVGFKYNTTYGRLWEARQIYGAIVNSSRSWGILARDYVEGTEASTRLAHRHIA